MRTTVGHSPLQLFVHHALDRSSQQSVEASEAFTLDPGEMYGAVEDGPIALQN